MNLNARNNIYCCNNEEKNIMSIKSKTTKAMPNLLSVMCDIILAFLKLNTLL